MHILIHLLPTVSYSLGADITIWVLDEADKLLNVEFEKALNDILKVVPKERKTFLFSATMTNKVDKLQRACLRHPVTVNVASKYSTVDTLRQDFYFFPTKEKDCYLVHVLNEMRGNTIMIFVRTCESTRLLALMLRNLGFNAISISGQMSQDKRLGALNKFKAKECNILTCTDVASRGLDIQGVDVVINYDFPMNAKDYVHRVGRTARAGRSGYAVSLVNECEALLFKKTEDQLGSSSIMISQQVVDDGEIKMLKNCVDDSKRIALRSLKELGGLKKRKNLGDYEEEMEDFATTFKRSKVSRNILRRRHSSSDISWA
ncbi:hypothetical protein ACP70R_046567 [Stipagrostis hirtigluma subsp. patula]